MSAESLVHMTRRAISPICCTVLGTCPLVISVPATSLTSTVDAHDQFGPILFVLAALVVTAKAGGLLTEM